MTTGAAGRAILSASPRPVVDDVIGNGLRAYTPASITDPQDYRAQLATDARPAVRAAAHHLSCRLGYSGDAWGDGDG